MNESAIRLKPQRDKPVRQGHPWIFSGAIAHIPTTVNDGDIVDVTDASGRWVARGYVNRRSQIQVRILSWLRDEAIDEVFWRRHIQMAIAMRADLPALRGVSAYRLINAENDYLPGLTVDRYGNTLVLQAGTLAIDQRKAWLAEQLLELTGCRGVVERSEMGARRQEGLPPSSTLLAGDGPDDLLIVEEHGLRFYVDLRHGQKTGFYTDQRENRQRVAAYCSGAAVLNAFSYTGAFAVHALAAGAASVVNVDSSMQALAMAEKNLALNQFGDELTAENIAGDIFTVLRDWQDDLARRFDVVVLDPPKFVHAQKHMERGLRGYKEINRLAMGLLKPGGILATFSCSGLVSADLFQKVIFGAAVDADRPAQILEWLRQAVDHPVAITFPEGEYLKGMICRVAR